MINGIETSSRYLGCKGKPGLGYGQDLGGRVFLLVRSCEADMWEDHMSFLSDRSVPPDITLPVPHIFTFPRSFFF